MHRELTMLNEEESSALLFFCTVISWREIPPARNINYNPSRSLHAFHYPGF